MNYISEVKAFYDRLELNPLTAPAIALWHALVSIANKSGWQQEFTVSVSILMLKSGLNAQAIKRARNQLEQKGYITWRTRGGNQSAIYHLNSLVVQNDNKNVPQSEPQSEPQGVPQSEPQSVPINKQNKTKRNETYIPPISPLMLFEEFWEAYPKKGNRFLAEQEYCQAFLSGVPEADMVRAAKNYAESCRKKRISEPYIKNPENFIRDNAFVQYVEMNGGAGDGGNGRASGSAQKSVNELLQEQGNTEFREF